MNKEKKILAISEDDFDDIVLNRDGNVMISALLKTASYLMITDMVGRKKTNEQ